MIMVIVWHWWRKRTITMLVRRLSAVVWWSIMIKARSTMWSSMRRSGSRLRRFLMVWMRPVHKTALIGIAMTVDAAAAASPALPTISKPAGSATPFPRRTGFLSFTLRRIESREEGVIATVLFQIGDKIPDGSALTEVSY